MTTTIPWKIGTTINEKFLYVSRTTGSGVTGKVQGDFTVRVSKEGTGNVSTTGITITEVSAANNPGIYRVTVSGATGFHASSTGEYTLEIFDTADPTYHWAITLHVTSDGDFSGTRGAASFTATASAGRVTDGSSAISGATVRIRNASNQVYLETTTDGSGLWGPVYFADDGTYTVDVQKSGYTTNSTKTIVVSGSTATGPSTDITIAVQSSTGLTAAALWAYARRMAADRTGSKADTEILQAVNDALDMVSQEILWPWLQYDADLTLQAPYSTGTIAVTSGSTSVTITGGTWPSWAASGKLYISGQLYTVSSRTDDTTVVLRTAWPGTSTTYTSWRIFQDEYTLATDFMAMGRIFPGEVWCWGAEPTSYDELLDLQNNYMSFSDSAPRCWALKGSKIVLYPHPSENRLVRYSYYKKPAALASGSDTADWDQNHVVLLRRAIDYQISLRYEDCVAGDPKATRAAYDAQMAAAKKRGRRQYDLPSVGFTPRRVRGGDLDLPAAT